MEVRSRRESEARREDWGGLDGPVCRGAGAKSIRRYDMIPANQPALKQATPGVGSCLEHKSIPQLDCGLVDHECDFVLFAFDIPNTELCISPPQPAILLYHAWVSRSHRSEAMQHAAQNGTKRSSPFANDLPPAKKQRDGSTTIEHHNLRYKQPTTVDPTLAPQDPVFTQSQLLRSIIIACGAVGFDGIKATALEGFRAAVEERTCCDLPSP